MTALTNDWPIGDDVSINDQAMASASEQVPGWTELIGWFGEPVSFHDAEIVRFDLSHSGESRLEIHWWKLSNQLSSRQNVYFPEENAVATFILTEIIHLDLKDFSPQNVIAGLELRKVLAHPE